jgi:hypothetical protein
LVWIGLGWVIAFFSLLAIHNFQPIVKVRLTEQPVILSWGTIFFLLSLGIVCMTAGYRHLAQTKAPDTGRLSAWTWLACIYAVAAYLRLYQADQPPGTFWDDWANPLIQTRLVIDRDMYMWMFPFGGHEPFFPYVLTGFRWLLPNMEGIVVMRLAACFIDLIAIWILYLAGKELGSRRIGLVAAGLAAVSRATLQLSLTGMRAFTLTLAVALLLLFTLRLLRKPDLRHFLLWGAAVAFGVHTYSVFRVFMLLSPFLLLLWVFVKDGKKRFNPLGWFSAMGAVLLLAGVYSGTFTGTDPRFSFWSDAWNRLAAQPWAMAGIFLGWLALAVGALLYARREGSGEKLAGWSLGLGFACLLVYPLSQTWGFNARLAVLSPFRKDEITQNIFGFFSQKIWGTFKSLFYSCLDRNDLQIGADPFYGVFTQGILVLALAFLIARPGWKKFLLLSLGCLGTLIYVISLDPASTKLIASAPPLFLLAGWAVSRIWEGMPPSSWKRGTSLSARLLAACLAVYIGWGAWVQREKIYGYWAADFMADATVAKQVKKDSPSYRLYLAPAPWFFGFSSQFVLNRWKRYYYLKVTNAIPVEPGKKPENVVVLVQGADTKTAEKLKREFPASQWEKIYLQKQALTNPNPELYMWRVFIPGENLTGDPKATLYCKVEEKPWLRRFYSGSYGWALDGIVKEERVAGLGEPVPVEKLNTPMFEPFNYGRLTYYAGVLEVPKDGKYEWSIDTPNPMWLKIDGKTVWRLDRTLEKRSVKQSVRLEKGAHRIEIRVRSRNGYALPQITWRGQDEDLWKSL